MDLSIPGSTTNSPLTPVFGDNVQDLLGTGALNVNPTGIIVVNSNADTVDDPSSGVITLRDAILQANADAGEDLIVFDRSVFSNAQTITLAGGELDITHNLDIIAPTNSLTGANLVEVSGNNSSRVFEIESGATVSLDGLIVANGKANPDSGGEIRNSGNLTLNNSIVRNGSVINDSDFTLNYFYALKDNGGGIFNSGTLEVSNSTITGNKSGGGGIDNGGTLEVSNCNISGNFGIGGGIYNRGIMTMNTSTISKNFGGSGIYNGGTTNVSNSTISSNSSFESGGGIFNYGTMNVSNSTISGNVAGYLNGGGIFNSGTMNVSNTTISDNGTGSGGKYGNNGGGIFNSGTMNVSNTTIIGNRASTTGGGIYNAGALTLVFSTLTLNYAPGGSGVYSEGSARSTSVRNTIIATNYSLLNKFQPDVSGTFTSNGYNLIGISIGSTGFGVTGDIVGISGNPIDPRLASLDNNGGSTQTLALLPDSPAIGAGDPTVLDTDPTTDQRGFPRRALDGRTDIGAYELSS